MRFGLRPGGLAKRDDKMWCVYASLADGHDRMPNITMIDGKLAQPYKFRDYGIVYCISTYYLTVTMGVEVWRTEAWCAMIMGNVPVEAIPYSFQCCNGETWHQDRLRHQNFLNQSNDCFLWNKKANEDREQKILEDKQKLEQRARDKRSAADAAAAPHQKRRRTEPKEKAKPKNRPLVPRWSEKNFAEGPYDEQQINDIFGDDLWIAARRFGVAQGFKNR